VLYLFLVRFGLGVLSVPFSSRCFLPFVCSFPVSVVCCRSVVVPGDLLWIDVSLFVDVGDAFDVISLTLYDCVLLFVSEGHSLLLGVQYCVHICSLCVPMAPLSSSSTQ